MPWVVFDAAPELAAAGHERELAPPPDVDHVVFVSVDGLNPQALTTLGSAGTPTFHRMMSEGASTLNARTTVEKTTTLPNHASMVTGRQVTTPGGHGMTANQDNGSTIHASAGGYVRSIFDVVHDHGGSTAMYVGKAKFDFLDRAWNASNGAPDVTGPDNGRDKIDDYQVATGAAAVALLLDRLAPPKPPTFVVVHFAEPDNAGHDFGFMSEGYLDAVSVVDGYVGQLLDGVLANPDLLGRTVVIVSADHGGAGSGHADPNAAANYTVPFFVWGAGVAGADLYALNPNRLDPGATQPPYSAPVPPIRTGETANLVADLLDLGSVPGSMFNADLSLDVAP